MIASSLARRVEPCREIRKVQAPTGSKTFSDVPKICSDRPLPQLISRLLQSRHEMSAFARRIRALQPKFSDQTEGDESADSPTIHTCTSSLRWRDTSLCLTREALKLLKFNALVDMRRNPYCSITGAEPQGSAGTAASWIRGSNQRVESRGFNGSSKTWGTVRRSPFTNLAKDQLHKTIGNF